MGVAAADGDASASSMYVEDVTPPKTLAIGGAKVACTLDHRQRAGVQPVSCAKLPLTATLSATSMYVEDATPCDARRRRVLTSTTAGESGYPVT